MECKALKMGMNKAGGMQRAKKGMHIMKKWALQRVDSTGKMVRCKGKESGWKRDDEQMGMWE